MADLVQRETAVARQLRDAWMNCWIVILTLDCDAVQLERVTGYVDHVSSTNARAVIEEVDGHGLINVPCRIILTVRRPHFHEPLDAAVLGVERRDARDLRPSVDGQLALDCDDGQRTSTSSTRSIRRSRRATSS